MKTYVRIKVTVHGRKTPRRAWARRLRTTSIRGREAVIYSIVDVEGEPQNELLVAFVDEVKEWPAVMSKHYGMLEMEGQDDAHNP